MQRVQFLLFVIIFTAIAGKVSISREVKTDFAVLSTETGLYDVKQFFDYKVNYIQPEENYVKNCRTWQKECCHT